MLAHRCIVAYAFAMGVAFAVSPASGAAPERDLEDYAQLYVDQYFEADERFKLSEQGKRKSRALAYYAHGRSLEAKGRTPEAVDAYKKVLANQPDQFLLARKTAYLLARAGQQDEALDLLETTLEKNAGEPFAYIALSEYLATYRTDDAESRDRAFETVETALEKFPDEPAVYDHLVKLYLVANRKDDARRILSEASRRDNEDPHYWLALGKVAARVWPVRSNGEVSDATLINALYGKALKFADDDWDVIERVGDYYHATSQFDRAASVYADLIASNPDRLDVREKMAHVYGGMGDEEKVLETLKAIIEIDPQNTATLKQIAGIYLRREEFGEAIPYLKASLEVTKGTAEEYGALARMMIQAEELELAADFLEETAYRFPESPDFPFLATFVLGKLAEWERSLPFFEEAMELAKEAQPQMLDERFYFQYAAAQERAGNLDEAEELFRKTIGMLARSDPNGEDTKFTATVYNYLGYMWLENDLNIDEAGELIKTAVELDPESGAIADSLGWYEFKKGNYDEALAELLRAEQAIEEPDAVIYDHIGQVFHELGEKEKAVEYLEKASALEPENEEFKQRLESYRKTESSDSEPEAEPADESPPSRESAATSLDAPVPATVPATVGSAP
ncbi:MAG: tetratricopeptide repeat protein [Verrucomicrobiales bacterium]